MGSTATRRGRGRHVGSMSNTDRRGDRHGWLVVEARVAHGKSLCVLLIMWSCSFQLYKLHVCIIRMWHILDAFLLSVDTAFLSVYPPPPFLSLNHSRGSSTPNIDFRAMTLSFWLDNIATRSPEKQTGRDPWSIACGENDFKLPNASVAFSLEAAEVWSTS